MIRVRLRWRRPRGKGEYGAAGVVALAGVVLGFQMMVAA